MKTHWKRLSNPDYLGAYALDPGQDLIVTIRSVGEEKVMGTDGKKEDCTVAHFSESGVKPMILNSTNCKTITKIYGSPYIEDWTGCAIQLYTAQVKAFGEAVDALRIRPYRPAVKAPEQPVCVDCGAEIKPFGKYSAEQMAAYTAQKYGKPLCADCAKNRADREKADNPADPLAENPESEHEEESI